jgi:hypothetical protein
MSVNIYVITGLSTFYAPGPGFLLVSVVAGSKVLRVLSHFSPFQDQANIAWIRSLLFSLQSAFDFVCNCNSHLILRAVLAI